METGRKKRPILLWQMIILIVLPLVVIVSAFFPRVSLSTDKIADICRSVFESEADMISNVVGGKLGERGMENLIGDPYEAMEKDLEALKDRVKYDISFTGWELVFLTDDMVAKRILHMTGKDETMDREEIEKMIRELREDEGEDKKILDVVVDVLSYMRVGYMLLYIGCLLLVILSVLWFVFKWDGIVLIFTNLAVSAGGLVVTLLGILNMGTHALNCISDLADLGAFFDMALEMFKKPMRYFSIVINTTFGGLGCAIVCMVMFLFAVYLLIDYFTLAKRRAAARVVQMDSAPVAIAGAGVMPGMPGMPGVGAAPGMPGAGAAPEMPGARAVPGMPGAGAAPEMPGAGAAPVGKVTVTRGEFKGAEIEVTNREEVILGRDPSVCHLVFTNSKISRKHCGVRYNPDSNTYFVKNYSLNGTTFASGQPVSSDVFVEVMPGSRIQMAEGREEIVLGRQGS